jgi:hypothetical protein
MSIIPALLRHRQEDLEFKASLGYVPCLIKRREMGVRGGGKKLWEPVSSCCTFSKDTGLSP